MRVPRLYVERLNQAMEARRLPADELARRSGYPLDLVEPLLRGQPEVISERMNHEVCEVLGLDGAEMWSLAQGGGERNATARDMSARET
jgi:hypothetical protein